MIKAYGFEDLVVSAGRLRVGAAVRRPGCRCGRKLSSTNDDETHPLRVQKSAVSSCFTGRRLACVGAE